MQHLLQKESRPRSPDVSGLKISFPARASLRGLLGNRQWKRLLNNERQNRYRISWAKNHGPRQWPFSRIASPRCILRQFLVVLNNPRKNSSQAFTILYFCFICLWYIQDGPCNENCFNNIINSVYKLQRKLVRINTVHCTVKRVIFKFSFL